MAQLIRFVLLQIKRLLNNLVFCASFNRLSLVFLCCSVFARAALSWNLNYLIYECNSLSEMKRINRKFKL